MSSHGRSGGALIRPQHRNLISNKNHNCNAKAAIDKAAADDERSVGSYIERVVSENLRQKRVISNRLHCGLSLHGPQITSSSKLPSALFILTAAGILPN
jgi:hypothetical protein